MRYWFVSVLLTLTFFPATSPALTQLPNKKVGIWNGFLGHTNVVECHNIGKSALSAELKLRDNVGANHASVKFKLEAKATHHIILNNLGFNLNNSYGTYLLETSSTSLYCHTMFYRPAATPSSKEFDYAFSIPAGETLSGTTSGTFNSFNPEQNTTPIYNWLSLYNPGSKPFSASIELFDQSGSFIRRLRVSKLPPSQRQDLALGHDAGQVVGLYRIVPDSGLAPYGAFLTRYSERAGAYNFAFPLFPLTGSADPGPLPASTMGNAYNWGEIANSSSRALQVHIVVRDRAGLSLYEKSVKLAPRAQYHLPLHTILGENNVGTLHAYSKSSSAKLLVQSLSYGMAGTQVDWAYGSQAKGILTDSGDSIYVSANTFLGAANWSKIQNTNSSLTPITIRSFIDAGVQNSNQLQRISKNGSIDVSLHGLFGYQSIGLLELKTGKKSNLSSETIRVYYKRDGSIATIMNLANHIVRNNLSSGSGSGSSSSGSSSSSSSSGTSPPEGGSGSSSSSSSSGSNHSGSDGKETCSDLTGKTAEAIATWAFPAGASLAGTQHIGVVSYHRSGIDRIEFYLDNKSSPSQTVRRETLNPQTQEYEYVFTLDTTTLVEDSSHTIRAVAHPTCGVAFELPLLGFDVDNNSQAATLYVDSTNGSDTNNGSSSAPFATIAKAYSAARSGDTIKLRNGNNYVLRTDSAPTFTRYVTLTADEGHNPIISDSFVTRRNFTKYENLTFHFPRTKGMKKMLYGWGVDYVWINNCTFISEPAFDHDNYAVQYYGPATHVVVENSHFYSTGKTMVLPSGGVVIARNNTMHNIVHDAFNYGSHTLLTGNTLFDIEALSIRLRSTNAAPYNIPSASELRVYYADDSMGSNYREYLVPDVAALAANRTAVSAAEVAAALQAVFDVVAGKPKLRTLVEDGRIVIQAGGSSYQQHMYVEGDANAALSFPEEGLANEASGGGAHTDFFQTWGDERRHVIIRNNRGVSIHSQGWLPQSNHTNVAFINNSINRSVEGWIVLFESYAYRNVLIEFNAFWNAQSVAVSLPGAFGDEENFVFRNNIAGANTTSTDVLRDPDFSMDYNIYDLSTSNDPYLNTHSKATNPTRAIPTTTPLFQSLTPVRAADSTVIGYEVDTQINKLSPARDAGKTTTGIFYDIDFNLRDSYPDIGPSEYQLGSGEENLCVDLDGDGFGGYGACVEHDASFDCNENNAQVNPGEADLCDGVDNNCDGVVDEDFPHTDADGDGLLYCVDNCPNARNANQIDSDQDGIGDVCDAAFNRLESFELRSTGGGDLGTLKTDYDLSWSFIQGGATVTDSPTLGKWLQTDAVANQNTLVVTKQTFGAMSLSYQLRRSWTADTGMVFCYEDTNNFYFLTHSGSGSSLINCGTDCPAGALYRVANGVVTKLGAQAAFNVQHSRGDFVNDYQVDVSFSGANMNVQVSKCGQYDPTVTPECPATPVVANFSDPAHTCNGGSLGVFSTYQPSNHVWIDNIGVTELPE